MDARPGLAGSTVHVCSLSHMPATFDRIGAGRLITIINERMVPATPAGLHAAAHLKIVCSDICEPANGRICPEPAHVSELIRFVREWDHQGPLLIHCLAGISRSTAAAYIALCALNETVSEIAIAKALRRASASAMPNRLLVSLADNALERHGRMLAGLAAIGPGIVDDTEVLPFALPSRMV